ncbi:WD40 repeat domain-containing protein [Alienimonas chondri]|uniref:WD40 repeat domain-containing protein n=1 Tax=Alienimonas chondri TaxID=2681879 RepID=A0ABX1V8G2_9PLAN|nr:hypothetical protein [Alienimonas chondri]NNJ24202.1 hypothetical protein [Alienimonas chondri]
MSHRLAFVALAVLWSSPQIAFSEPTEPSDYGAVLFRHGDGDYRSVSSLAYTADGTQIISAADDGAIEVHEAATGDLLRRLVGHRFANGEPADACDAAPLPGGRIVSVGEDGRVILWPAEGTKPERVIDPVVFETVELDEQSGLGRLAWEAGIARGEWDRDEATGLYALAVSPDRNRFAVGYRAIDGTHRFRVRDCRTGDAVADLVGGQYSQDALFTPDGTGLLLSDDAGLIALYDLSTGEKIRVFDAPEAYSKAAYPRGGGLVPSNAKPIVFGIAFSANGEYVMAVDAKACRVWDFVTGDLVTTVDAGGWDSDVVALADGRAAFGTNNGVVIFEIVSGKVLAHRPPSGVVQPLAVSPDGKMFIAAASQQGGRIYTVPLNPAGDGGAGAGDLPD